MSTVFGDRYKVERSVARGGMAEVFLASDTRLDRAVALKVMHKEFAGNSSFIQRFQREARAAAGLNHPNMVQVYDYGTENGAPYIVMEFVRGKTMRDLLRTQGRPTPQRAAEVIADVAGALQYAHENGIVHRDVKPANIMIDSEGTVKVTDFGIAQASKNADEQQLTQAGSVVGTAAYFSPEQAQGHSADARSDVYAMGCVLFELACGRPPFDGETPWAIAYKHVNEPAPLPSRVAADVPSPLEAIIIKSMSKNAAGRYQSSAEMRTDLLRFVRGEAPLASTNNMVTTVLTSSAATATTILQNEGMEETGASSTVLTGAPPASPPNRAMPEYTQGKQFPAPPREKKTPWLMISMITGLLLIALFGLFLILNAISEDIPRSERVPTSIVGMSYEEAKSELEKLDLNLRYRQEEQEDPDPGNAGKVMKTDPKVGDFIEKDQEILLYIGKESNKIEVPNFIGESFEDAEEKLKKLGFKVKKNIDTENKATKKEDEDIVLKQDPPAGRKLPEDSLVTLYVPEPLTRVIVPNVMGEPEEVARRFLERAGFSVRTASASSSEEVNTVIRMEPPADSEAAKGSEILIILAVPDERNVPNVEGKTEEEAKTLLKNAGFLPQVNYLDDECENEEKENCRVNKQDPDADQKALAETTVLIEVGKIETPRPKFLPAAPL